jgi:hypothetical protein
MRRVLLVDSTQGRGELGSQPPDSFDTSSRPENRTCHLFVNCIKIGTIDKLELGIDLD